MNENPSGDTADASPDAVSDTSLDAVSDTSLDPSAVSAAPEDFVGVDGPAAFVDESAPEDAAVPAARPRRVGRLAAIGAAAVLVLTAGTIGTVLMIQSGNGAACLVGSWKMSQFPAELGSTGAEMTGGQMLLSFTSSGHGEQQMTNIRVRAVEGPNSVVQGDLTYHYTASDNLITYTSVGGNVAILNGNVQMIEPQSDMAPDTYSCSGNTLTVNTQSKHPEVFTRA